MQYLDVLSYALTQGSWRNKAKQISSYSSYASKHGFDALAPSSYDICLYATHLAGLNLTNQSVLNYLSGASTWIELNGGTKSAFASL